jgi:hypothetical protein
MNTKFDLQTIRVADCCGLGSLPRTHVLRAFGPNVTLWEIDRWNDEALAGCRIS